MRHLRILALCLAAVFALTATTLVVASPALAREKCNQECKEQKKKEKQEAKEKREREKREAKEKREREREEKRHPEGHPEGEWEKFNECPLYGPAEDCIHGEAGPESFFQAGKVTVHFKKPVLLEVGALYNTEIEAVEILAARNGDTISKEAEPAPSLTEGLDAEKLEEPEKKRYEEYLAKGGSTKTTETVELATPAKGIFLSIGNYLEEEGEAFGFGVMIHIENKFLRDNCYVGTTVHPIEVPFTSGETHPEPPNTPIHGTYGYLSSEGPEGEILVNEDSHLVDNEYAAPGVSGCGINGGADAALDAGLGLPSPAGHNTTELIGKLYLVSVLYVRENLKDG